MAGSARGVVLDIWQTLCALLHMYILQPVLRPGESDMHHHTLQTAQSRCQQQTLHQLQAHTVTYVPASYTKSCAAQ